MKFTKAMKKIIVTVMLLSILLPGITTLAQQKIVTEDEADLIISTVSGSLPSSVAKAKDPDGTLLPGYSMDLYKKEEDFYAKPPNPIKNGDSVGLNEEFVVGIYKAKLDDVTPGTAYKVTLPEEIGTPAENITETVYIDINTESGSQQLKCAEVTYTKGSRDLKVVFNELASNPLNLTLANVENFKEGFGGKLDKGNLAGDDEGKISITLPGNKELTITIPELKPEPPTIEKNIDNKTMDADGTSEWKIKYTHPATGYKGERPAKIVDTIPAGLEMSGDAKLFLDGTEDTVTPLPVVYNKTANTLTYNVPSAMAGGTVVEIKYTTKLTNGELSTIWAEQPAAEHKYANKAEGLDIDDNSIDPVCTDTKDVTVTKTWPGRNILEKEGTTSEPDGTNNRVVTWTIKVKTLSRGFKELVLNDEMGKGLIIDKNSIIIKDKDGNTISSITPTVSVSSGNPTTMTIKLVENGIPVTALEQYIITYNTTIDPEYFNQSGISDSDIENKAWLTYKWPDGEGPSNPQMPPEIDKGPGNIGADNALINKSAESYKYEDNSIAWNIKVNPNQVNLTKAEITDDLSNPSKKHLFVLDSSNQTEVDAAIQKIENAVKAGLVNAGLAADICESVNINNNVLNIKLGNIGNKTFSFSITTYASDPKIWASNAGNHKYSNIITMLQSGTTVGNVPISKDVFGSADITRENRILSKQSGVYNPLTKKITWTLEVNKNAVVLGDTVITDKLAAGLSCNAADAKLKIGSSDVPFSSTDNTFSVATDTDNISTITINMKDVKEKRIITYETAVDVNTDAFKKDAFITFKNEAQMTSTSNADIVKSNEVTVKFENAVIDKTQITEEIEGKKVAKYTIKLNPYGMNLLDGMGADSKLTISDKLSDGLYLDISSIKFYYAKPLNDNTSPYKIDIEKDGEITDKKISYDPAENSFTMEIPDAGRSYIVEYNAYIVRTNVDLKNEVSLKGSVIPAGSSQSSSNKTFQLRSFGSAGFSLPKNKFISIQIKKVNQSGGLLAGAEFGLYKTKSDDGLLVKGTCDAGTGICTLAIPLSQAGSMTTLYWREETAPSGYAKNDEWHDLDISNPDTIPDTPYSMINVAAGASETGEIKVKKVDKEDHTQILTGASFRLFKNQSCEESEAVSDVKVVNAQGETGFDKLYPGRTYWVKEITAPSGYIPSEPIAVTAAPAAALVRIKIPNEKANASLALTKSDGEDETIKLKDVEFALYKEETCTTQVGMKQITDENGMCSFTELFPYTTYYLKEIKAAPGYKRDFSVHEVTTKENKTAVPIQLINFKADWDEKASLEITKTDNTGKIMLKNAVFELYKEDKTSLIGRQTTTEDGICNFSALKEGIYYIIEKKAPEGYEINSEWIEVTIRINTGKKVSIVNAPIKNDPIEDTPVKPPSNNNGSHSSASIDNKNTFSAQAKPDTGVLQNNLIPKTGVEDHIKLYIILIAVSTAAAVILIILLIKNKKNKKMKR